MKTLRLLTLLALAQIMFIAPAAAQEIVVDRMSASEEASNAVQYPYLDQKLRFSVDFGYAHRICKFVDGIPSDLIGKLRSGYTIGADMLYFPNQTWGFGAAYNGRIFNAKTSYDVSKVQMHYFGAAVAWRAFDRENKNAFIIDSSLGYVMFEDNSTIEGYSYSISKGGLGSSIGIGYDIRVSEKSFVGLKLTFIGGTVKIATVNGVTYGEDTLSMNFTVGLRF